MLSDLFFLSIAWWLAYLIRFETDFFPEPEPHLLPHYIIAWLIILIVWTAVFSLAGFLSSPATVWSKARNRRGAQGLQSGDADFFGSPVLASRRRSFSDRCDRLWGLQLIVLNLSHVVFREGLRFLRRRGYNLRHVLLIELPGRLTSYCTSYEPTVSSVSTSPAIPYPASAGGDDASAGRMSQRHRGTQSIGQSGTIDQSLSLSP